ncbi:unnamed protein product [Haemonchus placei]|uniref:Reverse transcriptase domain-containing protein n=1 Tax=Haemonchus placei TaxID=6290 RepID=A0A0N4WPT3_HAEPC|nr:unnamed protein product [Haemonchus placei]
MSSKLLPFSLIMDTITKEHVNGLLKSILYAEDIALIAGSKDEIQNKLQKWKVLAKSGLRPNVKKAMFLSSEECMEPIVDVHVKVIGKVWDFRYLRSDLATHGSVDQVVKLPNKRSMDEVEGVRLHPPRYSVLQDFHRKGVFNSGKAYDALLQ